MSPELLNAKHQDLLTKLNLLMVLGKLDSEEYKSLDSFRGQFQRKLAKKLEIDAKLDLPEFITEVKERVPMIETELSAFNQSKGLLSKLNQMGAKDPEKNSLIKLRKRLEKVLIKRYDISEEELKLENEGEE